MANAAAVNTTPHDIARKAPSSGARRRCWSIDDGPAVTQSHASIDRGDAPADQPGGGTQLSLCQRQEERAGGGDQWGDGQTSRLGDVGNQNRERAPGEGEPDIGMDESSEQLQVVSQHEEWAEHQERNEGPTNTRDSRDPQSHRPGQADDRHGDERRGGNPGAQWAPVQLVKCMRGESDRAEERHQRSQQPGQADVWGQTCADHHVGEMPGGVRGVQQRPPIPPPAGSGRVERRPVLAARLGRECRRGLALQGRCGRRWNPIRQPSPRVPHITSPPPRLMTRTPTCSKPA